MWELQQRKAAMVRDVLGDEAMAKALTRDDLEYLLGEGEQAPQDRHILLLNIGHISSNITQ